MEFFREPKELQGNQDREEEDKSSASLSVPSNSDSCHSSPSKDSSSERSSSDGEGVGESDVGVDVLVLAEWEGKTITGRLSNIRQGPQNLFVDFRFRAALHHEVADGAPTIKGIVNSVKAEGLVNLEALVTPEQLAMLGFVDVSNLYLEGEMSSVLERQHERAQHSRGHRGESTSQRHTRFDERPVAPPHSSSHRGYAEFIPLVDWQRAKGYIQQHGGHADMLKLMDAFSYAIALCECEQGAHGQTRELTENCKQLTSEKASLEDEVNLLQRSEMANRATSAESRADGLANQVNKLKKELERA
ncbi:hypothetical protein SLEP1_g42849 [Rubroshorea leprosula]|uniref:Uncharacterized protein n=1 Tax=Rubroshorea leprosula TaxID=152421 RepID=A0AAV5LBT6_9ROSI|nr:hypothetical protein SLEP1_g42849 [Rubroshorea leprosula]